MVSGRLITLMEPLDAFDNTGEVFCLSPETTGLILDFNEYDVTMLVCGEVLYTSTRKIDEVVKYHL